MNPARDPLTYRYARTASAAFRDSTYASPAEKPDATATTIDGMMDAAFTDWSHRQVTRICTWGLILAIVAMMAGA